MKLEQGQIWKAGEDYFLIVKWERLSIEYKAMKDLTTREGTRHQVTKKEFCHLIKGATLHAPEASEELAEPTGPEVSDTPESPGAS